MLLMSNSLVLDQLLEESFIWLDLRSPGYNGLDRLLKGPWEFIHDIGNDHRGTARDSSIAMHHDVSLITMTFDEIVGSWEELR